MTGFTWTQETVDLVANIMGATDDAYRFYWPYILFGEWPIVGHYGSYIGPWYSAFDEFLDAGLAEKVDVGWLHFCPTCKQTISDGVVKAPEQYRLSSKGKALLEELPTKFGKLEYIPLDRRPA